MQKILTTGQVRAADKYTITHQPISSVDLMESAAKAFVEWFAGKFNRNNNVLIFCGLGNNGGDGLAIARLLHQKKYKVRVGIVRYSQSCSKDFLINEKRLKKSNVSIVNISTPAQLSILQHSSAIIIDAIFGSGLNRPMKGLAKNVIQEINKSKSVIVSVDIPSGLFADEHTQGIAVKANFTVGFQLPKLAFLFPENYQYVGEWATVDIGLDKNFIAQQQSGNFYITKEDASKILKPRKKFDHKGAFGHALLVAGSYGKMGAALLAAKAAMRTGAGLVTVHLPKCGYEIMQRGFPEAMASIDKSEHYFSKIPSVEKFAAIGAGSGIDTYPATQKALLQLLKSAKKPMVIDADAINILGLNKKWLKFIPGNSILTPHPKEFERLAGKSKNNFHRLALQTGFAKKYKAYVILKTAHTAIATPVGKCFFNSSGNPGMATAGSGDVLTGILAGLLAQGYDSEQACILGVYLHGRAGDIAAKKKSPQAMIASDIIDNLGQAFKQLSL